MPNKCLEDQFHIPPPGVSATLAFLAVFTLRWHTTQIFLMYKINFAYCSGWNNLRSIFGKMMKMVVSYTIFKSLVYQI